MFTLTSEGVFQSSILSAVPWLAHGFASRQAGTWPGNYVRLKQIHSSTVVRADGRSGLLSEGDALVTSEPGQWIGIRTADCVPILIADLTRPAVGVIHAGWRGTVDEIVTATVKKLTAAYGSSPHNLVAAIGPCIGLCCFEVGPEVAERFRPLFPEYETSRRKIDLEEANKRQLIRAGLELASIDVSGLCTKCNSSQFHSYRRDREASGRMTAAIQIRCKSKSAGPTEPALFFGCER